MKPALTDDAFDRLRTLLATRAGLVFDDSRRDSLSYAVADRMHASGAATLEAYLAVVERPRSPEVQALLDDVTIPETYFFRNAPQFSALREFVVPELIRHAMANGRRIRVWSAGCSSGEEAYSIAILLRELLPPGAWDVKVIGTDISTKVVAAARAGRYGARSLGPVDDRMLARWFTRLDDGYVVNDEIKEMVEFRHHNLVADAAALPELQADLVLCRNVTIYFNRETTRALMKRLYGSLREGGYLFLGHSETLWQISDDFRLVSLGEAFVYRRDASSGNGAVAAGAAANANGATPAAVPPANPALSARRTYVAGRRSDDVPGVLLPAPVMAKPIVAARADEHPLDGARAALRAGNYGRAADLAGLVYAGDSLNSDAYMVRGLALTNLSRDNEALVDLRKAVYVDPQAGFAHFLLAGTLARLGDQAAAQRSYRAAAQTLGHSADDHVSAEMGGRKLSELIDLCWQLAGGRPSGV
ncbi:MAG: CheR family methyltransferase [Mycobacteriales bacterium]